MKNINYFLKSLFLSVFLLSYSLCIGQVSLFRETTTRVVEINGSYIDVTFSINADDDVYPSNGNYTVSYSTSVYNPSGGATTLSTLGDITFFFNHNIYQNYFGTWIDHYSSANYSGSFKVRMPACGDKDITTNVGLAYSSLSNIFKKHVHELSSHLNAHHCFCHGFLIFDFCHFYGVKS
ncbi:hypothetical protein PEPS_46550 (plasmid) [Persicobacter psychrovividus]|uniref:Uncharacterized protein n=1 Tax=Persicobacter psychrovividus TaxID=387638 RepID=A0ABM7VN22_9BACT|nr:hypothetical protein PEPS_46550 [Persicobacter psychrovividus]